MVRVELAVPMDVPAKPDFTLKRQGTDKFNEILQRKH